MRQASNADKMNASSPLPYSVISPSSSLSYNNNFTTTGTAKYERRPSILLVNTGRRFGRRCVYLGHTWRSQRKGLIDLGSVVEENAESSACSSVRKQASAILYICFFGILQRLFEATRESYPVIAIRF